MKQKQEKIRSEGSKNREKCCRVESVISIDNRGQMVLPKEIREKADIQPGNKFAVISWKKNGHVLCISLMRVEQLADSLKNVFIPLLSDFEDKSRMKGG
ncbi:MAG: AbrB/MazE/SpoVT family DNA-binding domain-containing protein [candidate division WOR-3 bacterium]|nr:MAG: AbrB/MazE/SpoVT family DNA-binding domain-containing protein [candidate division WOR-3 bacterium]